MDLSSKLLTIQTSVADVALLLIYHVKNTKRSASGRDAQIHILALRKRRMKILNVTSFSEGRLMCMRSFRVTGLGYSCFSTVQPASPRASVLYQPLLRRRNFYLQPRVERIVASVVFPREGDNVGNAVTCARQRRDAGQEEPGNFLAILGQVVFVVVEEDVLDRVVAEKNLRLVKYQVLEVVECHLLVVDHALQHPRSDADNLAFWVDGLESSLDLAAATEDELGHNACTFGVLDEQVVVSLGHVSRVADAQQAWLQLNRASIRSRCRAAV